MREQEEKLLMSSHVGWGLQFPRFIHSALPFLATLTYLAGDGVEHGEAAKAQVHELVAARLRASKAVLRKRSRGDGKGGRDR